MSAASDHLEQATLKAITGQATFPALGFTYIALHTSAPDEANGLASEVQTTAWPAYIRVKCEGAGAIGSGWSVPAANAGAYETKNLNVLTYPGNNGAGTVTVTHWSLWDAATGGNMKISRDLATPVAITPNDVFVFDINALTISCA